MLCVFWVFSLFGWPIMTEKCCSKSLHFASPAPFFLHVWGTNLPLSSVWIYVCMYVCMCVCMYVLLSLLLQQLVCLIQRIALTDVFSLTTWGMGCVYTKRLTRDMTRVILLWFMAFCIISVYSLCLSICLSLSLRCQVFICTYVHTCVCVCVRVCVCVCVVSVIVKRHVSSHLVR